MLTQSINHPLDEWTILVIIVFIYKLKLQDPRSATSKDQANIVP